MSITSLTDRKKNILPRDTGQLAGTGSNSVWIRPSSWLTLPDITGLQRFVGLHRIDEESNFVALSAAGNYTVDWGDGTTTNHNTGTTAYKQYTYSSINNTGESELGYRQVIIQVYPQAGQNLTSININLRHNQSGISSYDLGWLDIAMNSNNLTSITIGGSTIQGNLEQAMILNHNTTNFTSLFLNCIMLKNIILKNTNSVTNMSAMFNACYSLQNVSIFDTSSVTNMNAMFNACYALLSIPLFDTKSVTNMGSMFFGCRSLKSIPMLNTISVTTMTSMFSNCFSLTGIPLLNTSSVTSMANMFDSCYSLTSIPKFNTASVTNMTSMFLSCYSLISVPLFDTSSVTNMTNMFRDCFNLKNVPQFNTIKVSTMNSMFRGCISLETIPLLDTSYVLDMSSMFLNCSSLRKIPQLNTQSVTTIASIFSGCSSLVNIPSLDIISCTSTTTSFLTCRSLSKASLLNNSSTTSYASCKLSSTSLNDIYTNLANLTTNGDPSYSAVSLLLKMGGNTGNTTFNDLSSTPKSITANGNTQTTSVESKFGGSSALFDGTGDYLSIPNDAAFAFGTGPYTVEAWIYVISFNGQALRILSTSGTAVGRNFSFEVKSDGTVSMYDGATTIDFGSAGTISTGQWYHLAFCRSSAGTLRAFVNGTQVGTDVTNGRNMTNSATVQFPATANFSSANCYIDELRVTNGVGRYTSNFTAPTTSFPNYPTSGRTITVTGNWGNASDNTTIATNKGWTVTG